MTKVEQLEQKIKRLEQKICCNKTQFYDTLPEFPPVGVENTLYVDNSTGAIYIWDTDTQTYITTDTAPIEIPESKIDLTTELPLLTPLDTNNPTTTEVQAWATANLTGTDLTNGTQLIYNTPSGGDVANPDYTWTVNDGVVTLSNKRVFNTKTVYVDAGSGSDVTGKRGYRDFPFKTLNAGITATLEGDLLYVFPGDYIQSTPITRWINIHCESGVDWLLQSNLINTADFALAKIVNWKFDRLRQVTYGQYSTRPLNTLGGYNLTINTAEKVLFYNATKNRTVKVNKSINSAFGIQSINATDAQGTNEIENAEWDYTQGSLNPFFNSQNSNNAQISFYCKNLRTVNSLSANSPSIGYYFGSDIGTNKSIITVVDNIINTDPTIYSIAPAGPLHPTPDSIWRGTSGGTNQGLLCNVKDGVRNNTTFNLTLNNVLSTGFGVFNGFPNNPQNATIYIKISGVFEKGIPLTTGQFNLTQNCKMVYELDVECYTSMGVYISFYSDGVALNDIHPSNTIIITGRIKTRQPGMSCISIGTGSAASNNTNGTILLKDLTLINDGTESPIMCGVQENVVIQNVKTNSLITDVNIVEVGEAITRNSNYK
jgi:hypothetical protein